MYGLYGSIKGFLGDLFRQQVAMTQTEHELIYLRRIFPVEFLGVLHSFTSLSDISENGCIRYSPVYIFMKKMGIHTESPNQTGLFSLEEIEFVTDFICFCTICCYDTI
ncbi:hypothetical protein J23TS9_37140 [Paenibacillus sp. J23TS9]|nr:hypothetical protein J23TS9_37140 [Paenibacillus sp. J23TS9]